MDPAKEAKAQAKRLANHTTTLATEYARVGLDWETELRQRAKEVALMKELGPTAIDYETGRQTGSNPLQPEDLFSQVVLNCQIMPVVARLC